MTQHENVRPNWLNSLHGVALTVALLKERGVPTEIILADSGISEEDLVHSKRIITPGQEQKVFSNALSVCSVPAFGLKLGLRTRVSAYGSLGYTLLSAEKFKDALKIAIAHPVLLGTYFKLQLSQGDGLVRIRASEYRESESLRKFNTELCFASLKVTFSDLLGDNLPLKNIRLDYSADECTRLEYEKGFDCPIEFDAEASELCFDESWLDRRLPLADAITHAEMLDQCRRQNSEFALGGGWLSRVRQLLEMQLRHPPGQEGLAHQMNCSARSLRRHLAQHHTSYQQLVDDLRFDHAKEMLLKSTLPIYRIAEELGFSEPANFRQAFLRWSGQSASSYRGGGDAHVP